MPTLSDADAQPQWELVQRTLAALERLGEPVPAREREAMQALADAGRLKDAALAGLRALASRVLVNVTISPEARVGARRAAPRFALVQHGWRVALVRVHNPAAVPGRLGVGSAQAVPVNGVVPPPVQDMGRPDGPGVPTTRGDITQRWLDLALHDEPPLDATLEPVPVDFKLITLYARDAGRRSAELAFHIGPGTGDLAGRDRTTVHFDIAPARTVALAVRDHDGTPTTCSWLVTDAQGRVVPAQARRSPPDFFFQKRVYRAHGQSLLLPPGRYEVTTARGPEYLSQRRQLVVPERGPALWQANLQRWADPGARGWISGDHHIHAAGCAHYEQPEEGVGPEMLMPQVLGEALGIAGVLTWGPGFAAQKKHFTGRDDGLSQARHKLRYDLEVSGFPSSHCGHLALLGMKSIDYPGAAAIADWPSRNAPVLRWARAQGAITGYAHAGAGLWTGNTELPNHDMAPFNSIGANDFIVTLPEGLVDFISVCNHPPAAEMTIWYHTLNVGLRSTIAGETDWPCFFEESMGMGRSYVKVDGPLSYEAWCAGLKAGRSYVGEGRAHLMDFEARSGGQRVAVGEGELVLSAPAPVRLGVDTTMRLEPEPTPHTEALRRLGPMDKPYWHVERARVGTTRRVIVELVVNGRPVEARAVEADGEPRRVEFEFTPERSCWVALRVLGAAHTNPIWVTVNHAPVLVKRSAQWCRASVDRCWSQKMPRMREAERADEAARYDRARVFYERKVAEASS